MGEQLCAPRKADLRAFVFMADEAGCMEERIDPVFKESGLLYRKFTPRRRFQGHMGIISVEYLDRLFWPGRYSEMEG